MVAVCSDRSAQWLSSAQQLPCSLRYVCSCRRAHSRHSWSSMLLKILATGTRSAGHSRAAENPSGECQYYCQATTFLLPLPLCGSICPESACTFHYAQCSVGLCILSRMSCVYNASQLQNEPTRAPSLFICVSLLAALYM